MSRPPAAARAAYATLVQEVSDLRIAAGTWASNRREEETTKAIWDLFHPVSDYATTRLAQQALLAGAPRAVQELAGTDPLYSFTLPGIGGPDMVLLDEGNRVRVVVEHKQEAPPQAPASMPYRDLKPWRGAGEVGEKLLKEVVETGLDRWHPGEAPDCQCVLHTQRKTKDPYKGMLRSGIWQIDAYRCFGRWLADVVVDDEGARVQLDDPSKVAWIILDRYDRDPAYLFDGAYTAAQWHVTGYPEFARPLASAYRRTSDAGAKRRLGTVLWALTAA
jgi:hypothetical protein